MNGGFAEQRPAWVSEMLRWKRKNQQNGLFSVVLKGGKRKNKPREKQFLPPCPQTRKVFREPIIPGFFSLSILILPISLTLTLLSATLFVFSISDPKQNARSLLTTVSDPAFQALSHCCLGFALHGSFLNHFLIGQNSSNSQSESLK